MTISENPTEVLHISYGNNFPLVKYPFNVTFIFNSILLKVKISPLKAESLTHTHTHTKKTKVVHIAHFALANIRASV